MKIIVISDSFKGSLSSSDINDIANEVLPAHFPNCQVLGLPVADGGEGTVDCFLGITGYQKVQTNVTGPWGEDITAYYARNGNTAVIELAQTAGLPMVKDKKDPSATTTYGAGMQIAAAVSAGATHIILGLGGTATNDGGCGAAHALGVQFYNQKGESFCPTGSTLKDISNVDSSKADKLLSGVQIEVICDIDNIACGESGAAHVFAPQKGADPQMVAMLDDGLAHLISILPNSSDLHQLKGGGAAGGFGVGAVAFLGGKLRAGIEVVLDAINFEQHLQNCDLVITGEGKLDGQSLGGKVPIGVATRCKLANVPVIAIVGVLGDSWQEAYNHGISAIFATNRQALPFAEVVPIAKEQYHDTLCDVARLVVISKKL